VVRPTSKWSGHAATRERVAELFRKALGAARPGPARPGRTRVEEKSQVRALDSLVSDCLQYGKRSLTERIVR
jgi:hypothetical protein